MFYFIRAFIASTIIMAGVAHAQNAGDVLFGSNVRSSCDLVVQREGVMNVRPGFRNRMRTEYYNRAIVAVTATSGAYKLITTRPRRVFDTQPTGVNLRGNDLQVSAVYQYGDDSLNRDIDFRREIQTRSGTHNMILGLDIVYTNDSNGYARAFPAGRYRSLLMVTCEPFDVTSPTESNVLRQPF